MQKGIQLLALVLLFTTLNSCGYNKMVEMDEDVKSAWSQVMNVYEMRTNLAPSLIKAIQESNVLPDTDVSKLKAAEKKASDMLKDKTPTLDGDYMEKFAKSQKEYSDVLDNIFQKTRKDQRTDEFSREVQNSHPEFESLLSGLQQAEVRIKTEKKKYNSEVTEYNKYIRAMPQKATSGLMGFSEMPLYGMQLPN